MSIIRSCPFCGNGGKLYLRKELCTTNPVTIRNSYAVGCSKCQIYTPICESCIFQDHKGMVIVEKNGAKDAIERWNKRIDCNVD